MTILLFNAGSSSLKCSLMEESTVATLARMTVDWAGAVTTCRFTGPDGQTVQEHVNWAGHADAVRQVIGQIEANRSRWATPSENVSAVGHRIVHGGRFTSSVVITEEVRHQICVLAELAPLHNPPGLETISAAQSLLAEVPHVAVFDTAFHATIPPEAFTYAIPEHWTNHWNIRRYGFHGLSHAYCAERAAEILERPLHDLRLLICHLGHGCSGSAVHGGKCIDTTMGFTPLEGMMMATRSGSIDPGILLYVQQKHGLSADEVETVLNRESGLLGVSARSADLREVLSAASEGDDRSQLALAVYAHRVRQSIGALATTLGGVDALIFTAGVGENSAEMRARICNGLEFLGLELNEESNAASRPDSDIATGDSSCRVLVIATREDLSMLKEVGRVIQN